MHDATSCPATSLWIGGADRPARLSRSLLGIVVIGEHESGLVVRRYGARCRRAASSRPRGEAGYQARMLPPGWHFGAVALEVQGRTRCRSSTVPPGEIAARRRADGAPIPSERILAREVDCDNFQDAARFLDERRREGPSARVPHRRHVPHQPGAVPRGHRGHAPSAAAWSPSSSRCISVRAGHGRHRHDARRPPIPAGDLAGPDRPGSRQLPARPGVPRRRRLPRSAGAGAAVRLVEPQPVVRRRSSWSR